MNQNRWIFLLLLMFFYGISQGQKQHIFSSGFLPGNDTVWVFQPKNYSKAHNFPVVYLLHGWSGNYSGWSKLADLQNYADDYGFIVVCPDGFYDSYYLNSPEIKNIQFESFFTGVLYPAINRLYSTDTSKIFISGLSMGGYGAMALFMNNPELFLSAGSTSGVMDLSYSSQRDKRLSELLGEYQTHKEIFFQHSPLFWLKK
ncbi:MAG: prolyl oligopeptidase family serine peptidase [Bacteroidales bacterium]|nr:prolyl oligopeptidase family serine peptidase [Bacteroidales bacterium]